MSCRDRDNQRVVLDRRSAITKDMPQDRAWPLAGIRLLGARPGDSVLLYTDGVSEAHDMHGRLYPLAERAAALSTQRKTSIRYAGEGDRLAELLRDDLLDHVGGALRDDATLLYLRFADAQSDAEAGTYAKRPATEVMRAPIVRY